MAFSAEDALERLTLVQQAGALAHAYLISGTSDSGKDELAKSLAMCTLQCSKANLASHPDFHAIQPMSKSRRIVIEQIRILERVIQMRSAQGNTKVAIIYEADRLALGAANAFLKTLEEPPLGTYLFLLTNRPSSVLPTILSRCIQVPLRCSGERKLEPHEKAVVELFVRCLESDVSQIAQAFEFSRGFQNILTQYKETCVALEEFEADKEHYKNRTDGKWLEDREEQMKALLESFSLSLRRELIAAIADYLAKSLRMSFNSHPATTTGCLAQIPKKTLLKKIDCLERLQQLLDRGIYESLALEASFLELFSP